MVDYYHRAQGKPKNLFYKGKNAPPLCSYERNENNKKGGKGGALLYIK
jgi:hypothetical protein